jgi:hypothetical protein
MAAQNRANSRDSLLVMGLPFGSAPAMRADIEKGYARGAQAYLPLSTGFTYRGALDPSIDDASDKWCGHSNFTPR